MPASTAPWPHQNWQRQKVRSDVNCDTLDPSDAWNKIRANISTLSGSNIVAIVIYPSISHSKKSPALNQDGLNVGVNDRKVFRHEIIYRMNLRWYYADRRCHQLHMMVERCDKCSRRKGWNQIKSCALLVRKLSIMKYRYQCPLQLDCNFTTSDMLALFTTIKYTAPSAAPTPLPDAQQDRYIINITAHKIIHLFYQSIQISTLGLDVNYTHVFLAPLVM